MSDDAHRRYLRALGRRIWNEANDLKRTPQTLAAETGISVEIVQAVIAGTADEAAALGLANRMTRLYPISQSRLVVDKDDTDGGVLIMRAAASAETSRVFDRPNGAGAPTPYYEYRDTAMSRMGPFKPEWIRPLRVVADADPGNPEIAYNNGHLMHQQTFFIGAVNFYWKINGTAHCAELNSGDSNYVTPYVAHSFASRNRDKLGLIIAVTYGDQVHRALGELSHIGPGAADELAGNLRDAPGAFGARLARQLAAESLSVGELVERLGVAGIDRARSDQLAAGATLPSPGELDILAAALCVRPADLLMCPLSGAEEVVVQTAKGNAARAYPDGNRPTCLLTDLARCRHQPNLKGFEITLLGGAADFRHSLHEYVYNYGDAPVALSWGADREAVLDPGDSAYVRPLVPHAYARPPHHGEGHLAVVRTPGALSDAVISEYSTYPPEGRNRATGEDRTWF